MTRSTIPLELLTPGLSATHLGAYDAELLGPDAKSITPRAAGAGRGESRPGVATAQQAELHANLTDSQPRNLAGRGLGVAR